VEPARLSALFARTPGLSAAHLAAARAAGVAASDLLRFLLDGPLPPRARAWLEAPHNHLIDSDLRWIEANDTRIVSCLDPDFPTPLTPLEWAPATLFLTGSRPPTNAPALAVMGSRQASAVGAATAHQFAAELTGAGVRVISSLSEGIDAAALEGVLSAGGAAFAVTVTGPDRVYPTHQAALAARIRAQGCLISVFPPGSAPRRHHFAIRNRLIGALGVGILVIEAGGGSGALAAVTQARRLQRPVFAVPGSIRDPAARVCNQLIRTGATLVQQSFEILSALGISHAYQKVSSPPMPRRQPRPRPSPLDNKYEMLLDAAGFEPVDIDVLAFRTGWSAHTVASMLLLLELQGRIAPQPGGRFCRLS
jgi:DNA processing protein